MRLALPLALAILPLLAGCISGSSSSSSDVSATTSQTIQHDFRAGDTVTKTLSFDQPGQIVFTVTFFGTGTSAAHLCPPEEATAVLEVVDPAGEVRESVDHDIYGLNGTGTCGSAERTVRVVDTGEWALRFRGQAELSVSGSITTTQGRS